MRNIFLFLRRFSNFLFFIFLQAVCIYLIVSYSKFHEAVFGAVANRVTGSVNRQVDKADYYLKLKRTNDSLVKANQDLYNKLKADYGLPDTASPRRVDSVRVDSLLKYQSYSYLSAKVISSSISAPANYIVLYGDNVRSMRPGMGLININSSIIGVITEIDGKYAVAMSLLHKDSHISGKLFRSGETGTVTWDGAQTNMLTLSRIPKSAKVSVGDSVVTSGLSTFFPRGLIIGRVEKVYDEKSSNFYEIKVRSAADFASLEYGYAIASVHQEDVKRILEKVKQKEDK